LNNPDLKLLEQPKVQYTDENGVIKEEYKKQFYQPPTKEKIEESFKIDILNYDKTKAQEGYKTEVDLAEKELPKFDLSNNDKCTLCGAITTEKYICKTLSNQKMFTASNSDRVKWGLVYTKPFDEEKNEFNDSGDIKCEKANYIKSSEDKDK